MKPAIILEAIAAIAVLFASIGWACGAETLSDAWKRAKSEKKPLVVYVSAEGWCPSCRAMFPHWRAWKDAAKSYITCEIDAESQEVDQNLSIPRVVVFSGWSARRLMGYHDAAAIQKFVEGK